MAVKRADAPARPRHRIRAHACPDRRRVPARSGRGGDSDNGPAMYAMRRLAAWTAAGARIGMAVLGGVAGWNLLHCPAQGVLSAGKT